MAGRPEAAATNYRGRALGPPAAIRCPGRGTGDTMTETERRWVVREGKDSLIGGQDMATGPTARRGRMRYAGALGGRIVLTLLGAAGLIVGAFLEWTRGLAGTDLRIRALVTVRFAPSDRFVTTVGFVAIVLGLLAVLGLAGGTGWLTRLAGALGIVAFILFAIQVYRSPGAVRIGPGAWVALAGAVVALIGGFLGRRPRVVSPAEPSTVADEDG